MSDMNGVGLVVDLGEIQRRQREKEQVPLVLTRPCGELSPARIAATAAAPTLGTRNPVSSERA
jgi:hypothetical protein